MTFSLYKSVLLSPYGKAGDGGILDAIVDHSGSATVVVCIALSDIEAHSTTNIIGSVATESKRIGMKALKAVQVYCGVKLLHSECARELTTTPAGIIPYRTST